MNEIPFQERVLGNLVAKRARDYGDRTFLFFKDEEISYRELDEKSNVVANNLIRLGLGHGDKVAIMMSNCPEFIYLWLGLAKIGAIEVPINTAHRGDLLGYVIEHSEVRWIAIQDEFVDRLGVIADSLKKVERILVYSESGNVPSNSLTQPITPFGELLAGSFEHPQVEVKPSDVFCVMYTSGTTGPSKGAMLPHSFAFAFTAVNIEACRYVPDDILYTCLPLFHGNAQCLSTVPVSVTGWGHRQPRRAI